MPNQTNGTHTETPRQNFERVLSREPFTGLKAILDCLPPGPEELLAAVQGTDSYEKFLAKLGYRMILANQIHVQDAYSRVSAAGGIKAVIPYYDIPTHSSLPTLVNLDSTVTTTPKAATFFDHMLAAFKTQLNA